MAAILVDYENGNGNSTLRGVKYLQKEDKLYIFYSKVCMKIRSEYWEKIIRSGCELHLIKLLRTGKNGLDFYIAAQCGELQKDGETHLAIISRDKGYDAVIDFFHQTNCKGMQIIKAESIEKAFAVLTESDSTRSTIIKDYLEEINIESAYNAYRHEEKLRKKIIDLLEGTDYRSKNAEIMEYVLGNEKQTPIVMYRDALHRFGLKQGAEIYRLMKQIIH